MVHYYIETVFRDVLFFIGAPRSRTTSRDASNKPQTMDHPWKSIFWVAGLTKPL